MAVVLRAPRSRLLASKTPRVFLKEVLRQGVYQHPTQPWSEPLDLSTRDALEARAEASNLAIASGVKVWVPDGHSHRAEDNTGFARRFFVAPSNKVPGLLSVYAEIEFHDAAYAKKAGKTIRDVSVLLDDYGNEKGESWGERIVHVALVPDPVFSNQENFVALSVGGRRTEVPILRRTESAMPTTIPGMTALKSPKPLSARAKKALSLLGITGCETYSVGTIDALTEAILAQKAPTVDGAAIAKALSIDGASAQGKSLLKERALRVNAEVAALVKSGRIPTTAVAVATRLLSAQAGFALSASGEATEFDLAADVKTLLDLVPEGACVPIAERLKTLGVTMPAAPSADTPAFDSAKEIERRSKRLSATK